MNHLKPTENEITHLKVPKHNLTHNKIMMHHYSIYVQNDVYYLVKGLIFNVKQNHEIIYQSKNYKTIINKATK